MIIRIEDLFKLISIHGIGQKKIRDLIAHFEDSSSIFSVSMEELAAIEGIDQTNAHKILNDWDMAFVEVQLRAMGKTQTRIIHYWDDSYPEILKTIHDPPVLLFLRGELSRPFIPGLAIVGTRKPSDYGRKVTEDLASQIAELGIPVISGMARGIDTVAHKSALKLGATIAVLGTGVDQIYPPENANLAGQIIETGAILSELPMGAEPLAPHFPRRNRIISGLSLGTLVVEAGEKSGALITAYLALEQGREVFAVPGSIQNKNSRGPHRLIREGAKLVECAEDILLEIREWRELSASGKTPTPSAISFSETERKIWDILSMEPKHIDLISEEARIPISEIMGHLLNMEMKQAARQMSGMKFIRVG
jgi:DNA processing protein